VLTGPVGRPLRWTLGALLLLVGALLVFNPEWVRATFQRPATTVGERINLRASFGGSAVGLGAFVLHCEALRPRGVLLAKLLLWTMVGIGAARVVGFLLDGAPDTTQVVWIVAELALVAASAGYLLRARSGSPR
jgi:hypothetical protein